MYAMTSSLQTVQLDISAPFGLTPTVLAHGWWECMPFSYDRGENTLYRCERDSVSGDVFLMSVSQTPAKPQAPVVVGANTPRHVDAARRLAERVLNLHWDIQPLYDLCDDSPLLRDIPAMGAGRIMRGGSLAEDLIKAISFTNMRWPQAVSMLNRMAERYTDHNDCCLLPDGTWLRGFPDVATIAANGLQPLQDCGLGYRGPWVLDCARDIANGTLMLPDADACDEAEFMKALRCINGVGPATAGYLANLYGHWATVSVDSAVVAHVKVHHPHLNPVRRDIQKHYSERFGSYAALAVFMEMAVALGRWD